MTKGYSAERELETLLQKWNYATLRAPGSGGRTQDARPDVVAISGEYEKTNGIYEKLKRHRVYAIELKANSDGTAYLDSHEVEELEAWAEKAGAKAYVGIKPDLRTFDGWLFYETSELNETDKGYSVTKSMHENAKSIEDVFA